MRLAIRLLIWFGFFSTALSAGLETQQKQITAEGKKIIFATNPGI